MITEELRLCSMSWYLSHWHKYHLRKRASSGQLITAYNPLSRAPTVTWHTRSSSRTLTQPCRWQRVDLLREMPLAARGLVEFLLRPSDASPADSKV